MQDSLFTTCLSVMKTINPSPPSREIDNMGTNTQETKSITYTVAGGLLAVIVPMPSYPIRCGRARRKDVSDFSLVLWVNIDA